MRPIESGINSTKNFIDSSQASNLNKCFASSSYNDNNSIGSAMAINSNNLSMNSPQNHNSGCENLMLQTLLNCKNELI